MHAFAYNVKYVMLILYGRKEKKNAKGESLHPGPWKLTYKHFEDAGIIVQVGQNIKTLELEIAIGKLSPKTAL